MRLSRYLTTMLLFLLAVAVIAALLVVRLKSAFLSNPLLNAVLIGVWIVGIVYIFAQTLRLRPEVNWVQEVRRNRQAANELEPTPLMGSLARLMEARETLSLTPTALRAILDGIAVRLDESRETARYFVGLMIFLGLLGTFWGLLKTVGSVGAVVSGLSVSADPTELFTNLKAGLEGPLGGMGTAFGSSLLGLAGSLVLGFLDLQMGHAQNRFFTETESWLFASVRDETGLSIEASPLPAVQALVEKTAEGIDSFREIMLRAEDGWQQSARAMELLAERIDALVNAEDNRQRLIHGLLTQRMESDNELVGLMTRFDRALNDGELGGGQAIRDHLTAIEAALHRIADEQAQTRAQALDDARAEIRRLARTIGVGADENAGS